MSKPTKEQLDKINKFTRVPLTEENTYVFSSMMIDSAVTSYSTIIHDNLLRKFSADVKKGVGLLLSHDHDKLPIGRSFDSTLIEEWDEETGETLKSLYGDFYIALGRNTESQVTTDDIVQGIDSGTIFDTSIGFSAKSVKCSICGRDIRSWECPHIPGREYIVENDDGVGVTTPCYAIIGEDGEGELIEDSLVYAGACNRATIVNEYSAQNDSSIKNKPKLKLVKELKSLPVDSSVYLFYTKGEAVLMTDNDIVMEDKTNLDKKRSESLMKEYQAVFDNYNVKTADELEAKLSKMNTLSEDLKSKEAKLSEKDNEIGVLKKDLEDKEAKITKLEESNNNLTELNSKLKENADLVDTYKKDLQSEIIELGVRTQGNAFNKTLFEKFLASLSIEELKEVKEDFSKEVANKFSGSRITHPKVKDKNKSGEELYKEDFETEEEYRDYIAELAKNYAEKNNISIVAATKLMYEKYSERGDK
mgnify:CR=1 FL=1